MGAVLGAEAAGSGGVMDGKGKLGDRVGSTTFEYRQAIKRKRPKKGPRAGHKARSQWFRDNAAWPQRDAPTERLIHERGRIAREMDAFVFEHEWQMVGPRNIGGRTTSIVAHPEDADVIWVGSAGGGVWHSTDAGRTWRPQWHDQHSLNIGALAMDPGDPDVIYAGTGEANLSADSYPGVGLYRTRDGGKTWTLLARSSKTGVPSRIGAIAVDPFRPKHVWVGGVGHHYPYEKNIVGQGGIYQSRDGGVTWTRHDFVSPSEYRCHAIVFDPSRRGTVYVTVTEQGANNGIWRSTDGGRAWRHLRSGLPDAETMARTSLALAPSRPRVVYALVADDGDGVLGVFRSTNGGNTWRAIHGSHFQKEDQMTYGNCIAVSPLDPDDVVCGGVDLHRTVDGGSRWRRVTRWDKERTDPDYAHADHHALLFPAADPHRLYDMNDGGMDVSHDGGKTWDNRSAGLAATMYYDLDVAPSNADCFGGGAQDNGTPITVNGSPDDFFDVTGGDGGWLLFDPRDENHIFASVYYMNIQRWPSSRGRWADVSPEATEEEKNSIWMCYLAMHPRDSRTVFAGSTRIWRTTNDGVSWKAISPHFRGTVTAIEISRDDPRRIYVGTSNGEIFRSSDGGESWSGDISGAGVPGYKITRLASSPADRNRVIATVANFGVSHVFRSLDGGMRWEDVDRGRLPDVPHHAIAIPRAYPDEIYVANDLGVFASENFGDDWFDVSGGLPNVSVVDLVYHDATDSLTAATYGRSHWRLQVRVPL